MRHLNLSKEKHTIDFLKLPILGGVLLFSLMLMFLFQSHAGSKKHIVASGMRVKGMVIKMIPTASPSAFVTPSSSPTASVTAALEIPKGYCLNVPVLFYHHIQAQADAVTKKQTSVSVDSGIFDQQMAYLSTHGYTTIFVDQLVNALINHSGVPGKSIAVTFDDGYKDNVTNALPILRKYNIKANLMLSSGLVSSNPDFLTWDDIKTMKESGLFYFTDHTWSHFAVNHGTSDKIQYEIQTAQTQIKDHTDQTVNIFTYPYGSSSPLAISLLRQDGFLAAFTTNPGTYQCDSMLMTLRRTRVGNASLAAYGF